MSASQFIVGILQSPDRWEISVRQMLAVVVKLENSIKRRIPLDWVVRWRLSLRL